MAGSLTGTAVNCLGNDMKTRTNLTNLTLRNASETDVPLILSFIRELAEYEKLLHEVVATEAVLRESLFGEQSVARVVIGEWDDEPIGFALYFYNFSTFIGRPGIYLEDLYVRPEMRGKGIGKIMVAHLAHLTVTQDCGRLEWRVLDWNEPAIRFYRSIGAVAMDEWTEQRVAGKALQELADQFLPKQ
jgi:GNAT superfamily N-acetyltransferase